MAVANIHIGRFFMVSFAETSPSDDTLSYIQDNRIGGVIIFADHCKDQSSLKSWLSELKKSLAYPLVVAVDQEGGRVRRFQGNFPMLEAPRYYGRGLLVEQYRSDLLRVCERLREIGITLNLVPTLDLFDTEPGHVLNRRTFSDDSEIVIRFARETIAVHHRQGLNCCAKHFPGLGRSQGDPHHVLSAAELDEDDFFERELVPFEAAIAAGVETVMITHMSLPRVDDHPATISQKIVDGWLRRRLGFAGVVLTDDLLMSGATVIDSPSRLAVKAFEAGADMLLIGQDIKKAAEAIDAFGEHYAAGRLSPARMDAAARHIDMFRQRMTE